MCYKWILCLIFRQEKDTPRVGFFFFFFWELMKRERERERDGCFKGYDGIFILWEINFIQIKINKNFI